MFFGQENQSRIPHPLTASRCRFSFHSPYEKLRVKSSRLIHSIRPPPHPLCVFKAFFKLREQRQAVLRVKSSCLIHSIRPPPHPLCVFKAFFKLREQRQAVLLLQVSGGIVKSKRSKHEQAGSSKNLIEKCD
ncbi:hypothetical protein DY000_02037266 [Brassica cretica]|uniref:Uncharacterized protein n=1 Tax=Brassica cretica TaxID=69181 RepID=A0ABQ7B550_BRACR|nr:hypothetical protein DY000_02037266 [Brassica cretica]